MRIPLASPFSENVSHAKVVEAAGCNPALTRCDSGGSLHFLMKQVAARPARANSLQITSCPDFQNARVAQLYRVLRFERSGCRLESCREHHFPDVAQCRGIRLRSGKVWVRFLPSGPIQERNVNRTSEPGVFAKDIVRPKRKGSMPSAFRHFSSVCECKAVERHAFQACPSRCESGRRCHK